MKFQDLLKDEIDSLADDHVGSSIDNPIKKDAFKVSNTEKIKLIQEKTGRLLMVRFYPHLREVKSGNPKKHNRGKT